VNSPAKILLFDGVCNLCDGLVQFIIRHDKKEQFTFASLQSAAGRDLLRRFELPNDLSSFVYIRGERAYRRSAAVLLVLKDLGGLWQLAYACRLVPRFIRDWVYDLIARNRYRLWGKKDSCMLPAPRLKQRFLDW
jgi:predicted DCC family thiol-disulfide oxidoreductase YuxK